MRGVEGTAVPLVVCALLGISLAADSIDLSNCNATATRREDTICYRLMSNTRQTWQEAHNTCLDIGGKLLVIASLAENEAVRRLLESKQWYDTWLDAQEKHYTWRWLSGGEIGSQGCFREDPSDPDFSDRTLISNNTRQKCIDHCASLSRTYAALQGGAQCWCGDSFGRHGQPPTYDCIERCPGDQDSLCGGQSSNEVFAVKGSFHAWDEDQPNNHIGYQTCVELDHERDYRWNDVTWNEQNAAVCELDSCENQTVSNHTFETTVEGTCFLILPEGGRWFECRQRCAELGGDLATFSDPRDYQMVVDYVRGNHTLTTGGFWIGVCKWIWQWSTGEDVIYSHWDYDQPQGAAQSCATMQRENGVWKDNNCGSTHHVICQFDSSSVRLTTPTTTPPPTSPSPTTRPSTAPTTPGPTTPGLTDEIESFFKRTEVMAGLIVAGAVIVLVIVIVIAVKCYQKKKRKPEQDHKEEDPYVQSDHFFSLEHETGESSTRSEPESRDDNNKKSCVPDDEHDTEPYTGLGQGDQNSDYGDQTSDNRNRNSDYEKLEKDGDTESETTDMPNLEGPPDVVPKD